MGKGIKIFRTSYGDNEQGINPEQVASVDHTRPGHSTVRMTDGRKIEVKGSPAEITSELNR